MSQDICCICDSDSIPTSCMQKLLGGRFDRCILKTSNIASSLLSPTKVSGYSSQLPALSIHLVHIVTGCTVCESCIATSQKDTMSCHGMFSEAVFKVSHLLACLMRIANLYKSALTVLHAGLQHGTGKSLRHWHPMTH